jgi:hypothetical protein
MIDHPDGAVLSAFSLNPESVIEREPVAAHIADCELCQESIAMFRALDGALQNSETWGHVTAAVRRRSPCAVSGNATKVQAQDDAAMRILRPLLNSPMRFRNAKLASKPRCHTPGMVRMLCVAANERHERQPKFSLQLTNTACAIAKALPKTNESSRRLSMAMAPRERANALRYLGQFTEALESLELAERFFDVTPGADDFDLAIVWFIRATIFMKTDRLPEGIVMARDAARVFQGYGDRDREVSSILVEASCLGLAGHSQDAADAFHTCRESRKGKRQHPRGRERAAEWRERHGRSATTGPRGALLQRGARGLE